MQRPSPTQALFGMIVIGYGLVSYWPGDLPQWVRPTLPSLRAPSAPPLIYARFQDKQVGLELPAGWRWLAQKPDPEEAGASYFALSRFQGQNALKGPVSLRVDAIANGRNLSAQTLLEVLTESTAGKSHAADPIDHLPPGTAGVTVASSVAGRPVTNYIFVKPGGALSYVLSIGSADDRFTETMARRAFQSLVIDRS